MHPKVSIVVNNYNYERYLALAIDSALDQSYTDVEVLVVDDGSTDGSKQIIDSYGASVRAIYKENGGQASAFNVGIRESRGDFILLLDADDVLGPKAVETALSKISQVAIRLCYKLKKIDSEGNPIGLLIQRGPAEFKGSLKAAVLEYGFFPGVPTSGNFFRADTLKKCLPLPEEKFRICADSFLFYKMAEKGEIQCIGDVLAYYRIHGRNNFASNHTRFTISDKALLVKAKQYLNEWELVESYMKGAEDAEKSAFKAYFLGFTRVEVISDARLRGLDEARLVALGKRGVIGMAAKCFFFRLKPQQLPRRVFGMLTILSNELLPRSFALRIYALMARFYPAR